MIISSLNFCVLWESKLMKDRSFPMISSMENPDSRRIRNAVCHDSSVGGCTIVKNISSANENSERSHDMDKAHNSVNKEDAIIDQKHLAELRVSQNETVQYFTEDLSECCELNKASQPGLPRDDDIAKGKDVWVAYTHECGWIYYHNHFTGASVWASGTDKSGMNVTTMNIHVDPHCEEIPVLGHEDNQGDVIDASSQGSNCTTDELTANLEPSKFIVIFERAISSNIA